jgi:hypothetical protein
MLDENVKFIDVRLISCKPILVQLLKLISYIKYSLDNTDDNKDIVLTIKIKNRYKSKLHAAIDDTPITPLSHNGTITIGE